MSLYLVKEGESAIGMGQCTSEQKVEVDWMGEWRSGVDNPKTVVTARAPAVLKRYDSEHSYGGAHPSTTLHGVLRQE